MGVPTRRGRGLLLAAALVTSSLLSVGCAGASQRAARTPRVLAQAAAIATTRGFKMNVSMSEDVDGSFVSLQASGSFAAGMHAGSMSMDMTNPTFGLGGSMRVVIANGTIYERLPFELQSIMPGRKPWLSVRLAQLSALSQLPGLNNFIRESLMFDDPMPYAAFLGVAPAGAAAKDLGETTVNGVHATQYQTQINVTKLLSEVPTPDPRAAQQLVRVLRSQARIATASLDVWIDNSGGVRRVQTSVKGNYSGQPVSVSIIENITSYGPQPRPTPPLPGNTTDLFSLIQGSQP